MNKDGFVTRVHWRSHLHETAWLPTAQSRGPTFFTNILGHWHLLRLTEATDGTKTGLRQ